jgi:hypothetical protein
MSAALNGVSPAACLSIANASAVVKSCDAPTVTDIAGISTKIIAAAIMLDRIFLNFIILSLLVVI